MIVKTVSEYLPGL